MTKILITGAAGFVGRHLVHSCLKRGWEVVGLDPRPVVMDGWKGTVGDMTDRAALARLLRGVDAVFHEGAVSSSPMFEPDPSRGVEVNVMGSLFLLQACAEAGVGRFVHASTSSIYGNLPVPWKEDLALPVAPNAYAASKLAVEYLAKVYTLRGELETISLRYFSIYGPGEELKGSYANMISQFLWAMRRGEPPVIYGDGNQTRDFTHVDDVVRANFAALETKSVGEICNVGTGHETSINSLAKTLADLLGKEIAPRYVPNPIQNYVLRTLADTSRAERLLGLTGTIPFETGVRRLVQGGS
jgi:nucleoside-diphosphate-sugar epimerase